MPMLKPNFRDNGAGPAVVCLHSNASSSAQWRGLADMLSPNHRVLVPDSYGAGKSPDWHSDRQISLQDEVEFIEPVLTMAGAPFALVGHSYGAAVALLTALANPGRVRALVLYEPTLFSVVDTTASPNGTDGIRHAVSAAVAALESGNRDDAARHFIDYWMGAGSWGATPAQRRPAIAESVVNVRRWAHALFSESTPAQAFAALEMPVLYMLGEASPESAHAVAQILIPALPNVQVVTFAGLGHMAPVTQPELINAEIVRFLGAA